MTVEQQEISWYLQVGDEALSPLGVVPARQVARFIEGQKPKGVRVYAQGRRTVVGDKVLVADLTEVNRTNVPTTTPVVPSWPDLGFHDEDSANGEITALNTRISELEAELEEKVGWIAGLRADVTKVNDENIVLRAAVEEKFTKAAAGPKPRVAKEVVAE